MKGKIFKKYDVDDDDAFERYLHVIGASINELNKQMEEVD